MGISKIVIEKDMFCGAKSELFNLAQRMRQKPTEAERVMWDLLRPFRSLGFPFRRQHPVAFYIADFYCHKLRLVIEIDGDIHSDHEVKEHDEGRTGELERYAIRVIRFTNSEVISNSENVIKTINGIINKSNIPPPLTPGEGE
jgi:very-short-patch-repair endonuclease